MAFALSCITPSPKAKPFFLACSASRFECTMCLLAGHVTSAFRWRKGEGIRTPGERGGGTAVRSLVQLRITTC